MPELSISIVSHRQIGLVQKLLSDIQRYCAGTLVEVILTSNVEEQIPFEASDFMFPLRIIRNLAPKGFGANHNAAFRLARGEFFCVLNPDIGFSMNPFPVLIAQAKTENAGVVAPLVTNSAGVPEDSARRFPSPLEIIRKIFGGRSAIQADIRQPISHPDWVAGMFMLFPQRVFRKVGGFDERYFLYYEDVDLCARLTLAGYRVILCFMASVVHDARRSSHKNLRYMRLHLASVLRFFSSPVYRALLRRASN
ncbi:rhamnosyltransferase WbbL [Sideroxyarcus emersonii]|uniref:Rhamnosyltransferase WbbL n=1 Tax=Sideroxyarcus emersonii TaxID=2764705 RepID=A0AAN1XCG2_9PROT|nr:glycosyltransferase [Sideroxyarcus emersonii]BCK88828.1 rhamnosyltransferase WbbL [Sideroxyarcus emersonii]